MKILYYSPHPNVNMAAPSGPGTHIREVINGFENSGHRVVRLIAGGESLNAAAAISFRKRGYKKFIPSIIWQTLKDYKLKMFDRMMEKQLLLRIAEEKPDVIYERAYYLMGSGYRAAAHAGIKYVCEINAPYPQEKTEMEGRSLLLRAAVKNESMQVHAANKIVVVSSALKKYLIERTGVNAERILITPNAVNPAHIKVNHACVLNVHEKLQCQPSDKVIGFVGSIFPYHGVDLLIDAFIQLNQTRQRGIKLLIVGDGETLPMLKEKVLAAGMAGDVLFTGNVRHEDVYSYIHCMHICVMARSNWYGSPVKIFEYGAMQKLVIAPDEVPVHDVMQHDVHGYIIPDTVHALKAHIEYALKSPDHAARLASAFHQKVMKEHTWQHVADKILAAMN